MHRSEYRLLRYVKSNVCLDPSVTQAQEAVSEMSLDNRGDDDDDDDDEPAADMEEFEESGMLDEDTVSHILYL